MIRRPRPLSSLHRRARARWSGDRGTMALSLAIVFPTVLTLVLLVVQASLWWYASQIALSAAREGAEAGRIKGGTETAAKQRATDFVRRFGNLAELDGPSALDTRTTDLTTFRMSVSVKPLSLLPGVTMPPVRQYVDAPLEKFVRQGGKP